MNEKQQIAEAERRFEKWWEAEGEDILFADGIYSITKIKQLKRLSKMAWMNGAFVARENN